MSEGKILTASSSTTPTERQEEELAVATNVDMRNKIWCGPRPLPSFDGRSIRTDGGHNKTLVTVSEFYERKGKDKECWHDLQDDVMYFHIGKAGGGTIERELKSARLSTSYCHPFPKQRQVSSLKNGPPQTLIMNIRDPVDRFVSAFYWDLTVACHPDDKRKSGIGAWWNNVDTQCVVRDVEEKMLREKYKGNVDLLARAMCDHATDGAGKDYESIEHAITLTRWLNFVINPESRDQISNEDGVKRFLVIPLEEREAFKAHIKEMMEHLLHMQYPDQNVVESIMESASLHSTKLGSAKDIARMEHSSSKLSLGGNSSTPNNDSGRKRRGLSPLGECCVTRHLMEDYRLIHTMLLNRDNNSTSDEEDGGVVKPLDNAHDSLHHACLWGGDRQQEACRADLLSMLKRRAEYLDLSRGSCAKVVSGSEERTSSRSII